MLGFTAVLPDSVNWVSHVTVTTDGGAHWNSSAFTDSVGFTFTLVKFVSPTKIIAFEHTSYSWFQSTDFGKTWQQQEISPNAQVESYDDYCVWNDGYIDAKGHGFIFGSQATMFELAGGGASGHLLHHYSPVVSPVAGHVVLIEGLNSNPGILHATCESAGDFLQSTDGGITWYSRRDGNYSNAEYVGIHFTSLNSGILVSNTNPNYEYFVPTLSTVDAGLTWQQDLAFPRVQSAYFGRGHDGDYYVTGDSIMFRSGDEGHTWTSYGTYFETAPEFPNRKVNWSLLSVGAFGFGDTSFVLVKTTDSLFQAKVLSDFDIPGTSLAVTTDAGKSWHRRSYFPYNYYVNDIAFLSSRVGFVCGDSNRLFKTTDGGFNWSLVAGLDTAKVVSLSTIRFSESGKLGVIAGDHGTIYSTRDFGNTWTKDSIASYSGSANLNFQTASISGDSLAIIGCPNGLWRKVFLPATTDVNSAYSPSTPGLSIASYPSPASGSVSCTIYGIDFLSNNNQAQCAIYDMMGRRTMDLSELVRVHTGRDHSTFEFSTAGLPSGPYVVQLQTANGSTRRALWVMH